METIESLIFVDCDFQNGVCLFPPKLKVLQIIPTHRGESFVIEDLPKTLESFECRNVHLKRSTEAGFILPPRLLNLEVSRLRNSEGNDGIEILPFDLPAVLLSLNISYMSLQTLPSLCLGSLRSIELSRCGSLSTLPPFPQSLLKLGITSCHRIASLNLPNDLEELSCEWCDNLD
jgi:hypothetical protein